MDLMSRPTYDLKLQLEVQKEKCLQEIKDDETNTQQECIVWQKHILTFNIPTHYLNERERKNWK